MNNAVCVSMEFWCTTNDEFCIIMLRAYLKLCCTFSCSEDNNAIVGFTAHVDGSATYNTDDVIQFPAIKTNYGGYYNPDTSIFTCPYDGIYLFFSSLLGDGTNTWGHITRGSSWLVGMESKDESSSASNLVITECLRGEKMWVRQHENADDIDGHYPSTFSGYLLQLY